MRGLQPAVPHAVLSQHALGLSHRLFAAGEHRQLFGVERGDAEAAARAGQQAGERLGLLLAERDAQHRAARQLLHQAPARRHQPQPLRQGVDSGLARRDVLAHAVPEHRARRHAPAAPQPAQRVLHDEERGLRHGSLSQHLARRLLPARLRVEHAPDVVAGLGFERLGALVHGLAVGRLTLVELAAHVDTERVVLATKVQAVGGN